MITGDNPLTAVHVARDVEIVDREALILDLKENPAHEGDLIWHTVDDRKVIPMNPSEPIDTTLFDDYDICVTGAALRQFDGKPGWDVLIQNTWVYARVSPAQKEAILTTLKTLGFITLMAGDGTNDVGALKQAHIGVALLDGTVEDLQKIAERQRLERIKKVYEQQLKITQRFRQPPPPVPPILAQAYPELVRTQQSTVAAHEQALTRGQSVVQSNLQAMQDKLADMDDEDDVPQIKLGDASCAAPFTSKLSNVSASTSSVVIAFTLQLTLFVLFSHVDYPSRPMHPSSNHSDVQDPGTQLFDYGMGTQRAISGWNQVWRLPNVDHGHADVGLLPLYLSCKGMSVINKHGSAGLTALVFIAGGEAVKGAAVGQHLQLLRSAVGASSVRPPYCHYGVHYQPLEDD
jgi:magnesium-transporting ATPase (P-type)